MAQSPAFTIVVPVYNGAAYLAEALESVLTQTLKPKEILVLDDGSSDHSVAVAAEFGDRIRLIRKQNSGVSDTRNVGASLASSEWLHFFDQDDVWLPDHLASHARVLAENPSADVCYSNRRHLVRNPASGRFSLTPVVQVPAAEDLAAMLMERCPFTPSAVSLRRSIFLAAGGFDSRHNSVEDWDLWLRLLRRGAVFVRSAEPTLHYRIHSAANSNDPLPVLEKNVGVIRQNILPYLSPLNRITTGRRLVSRLEAEAAILLRENRLPGACSLMLRSIARHPVHEPRRYKILLSMLRRGSRARLQEALPAETGTMTHL